MAQLAHVARPGVGQQQLPSACVDGTDVLAVLGVEALDEVLRQDQDVVASFSEWREVEDDHGEPKVEIPAELLAPGFTLEVAIARGQDADIDPAVPPAPDSTHGPLLDRLEELSLGRQPQVSHRVGE